MSLKLTGSKPDDFYTRMPLRFRKKGPVIKDADGEEGWIEFWHADAVACRDALRRITAQVYAIQEAKSRRTSDDELSTDEALGEMERLNDLTTHGLALRVKAWRLIVVQGPEDTTGDVVDAAVTIENAKSVLGDTDYDLKGVSTDWLNDPENFTLRASTKPSTNSKNTQAKASKDSSA